MERQCHFIWNRIWQIQGSLWIRSVFEMSWASEGETRQSCARRVLINREVCVYVTSPSMAINIAITTRTISEDGCVNHWPRPWLQISWPFFDNLAQLHSLLLPQNEAKVLFLWLTCLQHWFCATSNRVFKHTIQCRIWREIPRSSVWVMILCIQFS